MLIKILKDWTLPIAMCIGLLGYPLLIKLAFLLPTLIFLMLLFTFSKISVKDLRPRMLHLWLLLIQTGGTLGVYYLLRGVDEVLAQAVMVCVICPTATSAAVITGKLGGSAASVSTYTFIANMATAVAVPVFFPIVEPHAEVGFFQAFWVIFQRVFVLLICPFLLAWAIRRGARRLHDKMVGMHDFAFYLWAFALAIVTARILSSLLNYDADWGIAAWIALSTFIVCCLQFFLGKSIGGVYGDRISGGQALGQKNTVLAIWMAHAYLNPLAAIGPGFYVFWQNMINSWQLWKKRKKDMGA